jgi:hypothetical protein
MRKQFLERRLEKTGRIITIGAFISSRYQQNRHFECTKLADDLTTNAAWGDRLRYVPKQTSNWQREF